MKLLWSTRKGFTLLELLVVISIIAILITFGVSSYSTAQKKTRDSKRKTDMRDLQSALEQYYSICGFVYPTPENGFYTTVSCDLNGNIITPLSQVPTDPRGVDPYYCPDPADTNCSATQYTICAKLEAESGSDFCVSNQQ